MWVSIQTLLQQHHLSRLCRRTCVLHQVMKPSIAMLLLEATITQGHLRGVGGRGTTQAKMSRQAHQSNRWRTTQKMLRPQHLIMNTWPWRSQPLTPDAAHGSQHTRWPPPYTAPARISSRTHLYGHTYSHEDFTGHTSAIHDFHSGSIKATHMLFPENSAQGRSPTTTPRNIPKIYQQDFHQI